MRNLDKKVKNVIWGFVAFVALIILITVVALFIRDQQYAGTVVSIKNYTHELSEESRENLEKQLRRLLNLGLEVPNGERIEGIIREDTLEVNRNDEIYNAKFIIDIDQYKQTFVVNMSWSDGIEIPDGIIVSCPERALMKYPESSCKGMYDDSEEIKIIAENPIYNDLPIIMDEFDFASRMAINYEVRATIESGKIILNIKDYSGGNYQNALQKIRDLGYEPEDYEIKYYDESGDF